MLRSILHRAFLRPRILAAAVALALAASAPAAKAAFTFTLQQVGGNVVINGTGTLNTTALTLSSSSNTLAQIAPFHAILFDGPTNFVPCSVYTGGGLSGPTSFGTGSGNASAGAGNLVGIDGFDGTLWVPSGYSSGTALTDTTTYAGTFASIGFAPGTYVYTWGTGANADSLTVTGVVPEPSTWALLGLGLAGAGVVTLRQRRRARLA